MFCFVRLYHAVPLSCSAVLCYVPFRYILRSFYCTCIFLSLVSPFCSTLFCSIHIPFRLILLNFYSTVFSFILFCSFNIPTIQFYSIPIQLCSILMPFCSHSVLLYSHSIQFYCTPILLFSHLFYCIILSCQSILIFFYSIFIVFYCIIFVFKSISIPFHCIFIIFYSHSHLVLFLFIPIQFYSI